MKHIQLGIISLVFLIALAFAVSAETCHNSVQNIPATCEGASISSDTWDGGRHITCGSTTVAAWDKSGFFEMYKQSGGSDVRICIGSTCIKEGGYAKSSDFPICTGGPVCTPSNEVCDGVDNDCDGQVDENDVCSLPPPSNQTCYAKVNDLPVTCTGGTVTTDNKGGCRTVICANGGSSMQAMACDKPTSNSPTFYEVYQQGKTGSAVSRICFGSACVDGSGYAQGSFPYCVASNNTNSTNETYCAYNGVNYTPGQSFPAGDGCNTCTCGSNGQVMCTQQACGPSDETCYNSLNELPANCTGTITSDVKGAGRTISCTGSSGSVQVQAWEKTGTGGKHFEINRQSYSGTPPTICIGKTCLKPGWGYAKSDNFPICMNSTNQTTPPNSANSSDPGASSSLSLVSGTVNGQSISPSQRVVTVAPGAAISGAVQLAYTNAWPTGISIPLGATRNWDNQQTCYLSYGDATGGGKTVDIAYTAPVYQGDYAITFAYRAETTTAHVFSMTNWAREPLWYDGNDIAQWSSAQITAANANGRATAPVLFTDGYRNVSVPATAIIIRVSNNVPPQNTSGANVTIITDATAEHNVVFRCDSGFNATQYFWTFSDGTSFNKTDSSGYQRMETYPEVYHTFPGNGTYTATCTATNGNRTVSGSTQVTVSTRATPAQIAQTPIFNIVDITHMGGNTFNIACDAVGANDFAADWVLSGNGLWYMPNGYWSKNLTFTFNEQKNYTGGCTTAMPFNATAQYFNEGHLSSGCSAPYLCSVGATAAYSGFDISVPRSDDIDLHGGIYARQVEGLKYEFWCNMPSFGGPYDVDFGDGNHSYGLPARANHTYAASGDYSISCHYDASPGYGGVQASWWTASSVQVGTAAPPSNASISIAPWYPQGRNYVFQCRADGFNATRYDYSFGDGQSWSDVSFGDTYHSYADAGTYNVSCTAENDAVSRSASMVVTVS